MLERTISRKVVEWLYGHEIIERSESNIYVYTYDFYDAGTYLDCSVGCYFGVVGASEPIWWSATTQVTIPNL